MGMKSDIEIARECKLEPIEKIAAKLDIPQDELELYGKYVAKVPERLIDEKKVQNSNLILVTAITPTKAGIGKTTVSIGLALGLNKIGKKAVVALREPSLGPCFGMKWRAMAAIMIRARSWADFIMTDGEPRWIMSRPCIGMKGRRSWAT